MGNTNKHPKEGFQEIPRDQPKRRSFRKSLRLSRTSSSDALSSTQKFLQSLNEDFEKGIIYHMSLEDLKKIETELDKILTDLGNLAKIGVNTSKRFELENTAKYFRNKIKSAKDNHMDSAIQRLNSQTEANVHSSDVQEVNTTASSEPSPGNVRIENKEQVAAKLKELSIKTREIMNLLSTMNEIDKVTKDSAIRTIEKCKRELYNIETNNQKLINKKWKCFCKIEEITAILEDKANITRLDEEEENAEGFRSNKANTSSCIGSKYRAEDQNDDGTGIDADIEDNSERAVNKERLVESDDLLGKRTKSLISEEGRIANIVIDGVAEETQRILKDVKTRIKKIHSFVLSLDIVDEFTKTSTEDSLKKCITELRNLSINSGNLIKKKIRYLKRIEEISAVLHNKYYEGSEDECSSLTDDKEETKIKYQRVISELSEREKPTETKRTEDNNLSAKVSEIKREKSASNSGNETSDLTKHLSDNFETTKKKLNEIFLTRSVSFEDLEAVSQGIDSINKQFDQILEEVYQIQQKKKCERNENLGILNKNSNETKDVKSKDEAALEAKIRTNDTLNSDNQLITTELRAKSDKKTKPTEDTSRENSVPIKYDTWLYDEIINKANIASEHNEHVDMNDARNDSYSTLTTSIEATSKFPSSITREITESYRAKSNSDSKRYKQTHSMEELDVTEKTVVGTKRFSEQNLNKMELKTMSNLVSMRNIDLSQIVSKNSSKVSSSNEFERKTVINSITTRNIDLSQMACRDSDMSLTEVCTTSYDELFNDVFSKEPENGEAASSGDEGGITILTHSTDASPAEKSSIPAGSKLVDTFTHVEGLASSVIEEDIIAKELGETEKRLEAIKEKIMNFVGVKSDDLYNELDEELVNIMMAVDNLNIPNDNLSYPLREKIVGDVYKFSGILEKKNLDHEYLDTYDKEISFVGREIRQSLANEKLQNLKDILRDIDDMILELEERIVDHLLISRKENCVRKLNSFREQLKVFLK